MNSTPSTRSMIRYRIIDLSRDGSRMSLRDADGMLHVARLWMPLLRDDILRGRRAKLGAHLLLMDGTNAPTHIRFEALACTQAQALDLLHPLAPEPIAPTMPSMPTPGQARRHR